MSSDEGYDDSEESQHPELNGFDRRGFQATHVLSNALKYGVIFAVAGAILLAALPGLLLAPVAAIASIFSSSAGGAIASGIGAIAWTGALYGSGLGAATGRTQWASPGQETPPMQKKNAVLNSPTERRLRQDSVSNN